MTPERIAELRALCEAAAEEGRNQSYYGGVAGRPARDRFIATARTALPEALGFIAWLRDELADLKGDLRAAEEREAKLRAALSELVDCCLSEDDGCGEGSPVGRAMKALARAALSGEPTS
jgi:hypothetical protein